MQVLRCAVVFLFMSRISESFRTKYIFVRICCEYPHPRFVLFFVVNFLLLCCGIFLGYRSLLIAFFVFSVGCVLCSPLIYEFPFRISTLCCLPYVSWDVCARPLCRVLYFLFFGGGEVHNCTVYRQFRWLWPHENIINPQLREIRTLFIVYSRRLSQSETVSTNSHPFF